MFSPHRLAAQIWRKLEFAQKLCLKEGSLISFLNLRDQAVVAGSHLETGDTALELETLACPNLCDTTDIASNCHAAL
jgi:hypothetical protein